MELKDLEWCLGYEVKVEFYNKPYKCGLITNENNKIYLNGKEINLKEIQNIQVLKS